MHSEVDTKRSQLALSVRKNSIDQNKLVKPVQIEGNKKFFWYSNMQNMMFVNDKNVCTSHGLFEKTREIFTHFTCFVLEVRIIWFFVEGINGGDMKSSLIISSPHVSFDWFSILMSLCQSQPGACVCFVSKTYNQSRNMLNDDQGFLVHVSR